MTEDTLRAWLRGHLSPVRRREVTVWMLRCKDPALPLLLEALTREYEDEQADRRLLARVPGASPVVEGWRWLLEMGRAAWTAGQSAAALAVLSTGERVTEEGLLVVAAEEGALRLGVRLRTGGQVALFVSDDAGGAPTALLNEPLGPGTWNDLAAWQPELGDGRITLWLFFAPQTLPDSLGGCLDAARRGSAQAWARRWEADG
ncbi:hypothetical protein L6R53_05120 [Myxococcota bacterium]|nr:hypothetical protein [Myxococcota bacterium]